MTLNDLSTERHYPALSVNRASWTIDKRANVEQTTLWSDGHLSDGRQWGTNGFVKPALHPGTCYHLHDKNGTSRFRFARSCLPSWNLAWFAISREQTNPGIGESSRGCQVSRISYVRFLDNLISPSPTSKPRINRENSFAVTRSRLDRGKLGSWFRSLIDLIQQILRLERSVIERSGESRDSYYTNYEVGGWDITILTSSLIKRSINRVMCIFRKSSRLSIAYIYIYIFFFFCYYVIYNLSNKIFYENYKTKSLFVIV